MNKSEVCVRLTRKNCKKVLGILEMFGERPSPGLMQIIKNSKLIRPYEHIYYNQYTGTFYRTSEHPVGKDLTLIKPRELRNILAKEHLKAGDVVILDADSKTQYVAKIDSAGNNQWGYFGSTLWAEINTDDKTIETQEGLFDNFLRFATDEEKTLLEPKTTTQTIVREVWVNVYPSHEVVHFNYLSATGKLSSGITGQTVKGTLTYDIPMTKV